MSEWRDMETAPRDGTAVLGWAPDSDFVDDQPYVVMWGQSGWTRSGDDYNLTVEPLVWQPLPEPPDPPTKRNTR